MVFDMSYKIFNDTVTVSIGSNLIEDYKKYVGPFDNKKAEYLAVTSGCDEKSSIKDLEIGIREGIEEEISVYRDKDEIIKQAINKGLIC